MSERQDGERRGERERARSNDVEIRSCRRRRTNVENTGDTLVHAMCIDGMPRMLAIVWASILIPSALYLILRGMSS